MTDLPFDSDPFGDLDKDTLAKLVSDVLQSQTVGENEKIKQVALALQAGLQELSQTQAAISATHADDIKVLSGHVERRMEDYERSLRWQKLFSFGLTFKGIKEQSFDKGLEEAKKLRDQITFASHPGIREMYQAQVETVRALTAKLVELLDQNDIRLAGLDVVKKALGRLLDDV